MASDSDIPPIPSDGISNAVVGKSIVGRSENEQPIEAELVEVELIAEKVIAEKVIADNVVKGEMMKPVHLPVPALIESDLVESDLVETDLVKAEMVQPEPVHGQIEPNVAELNRNAFHDLQLGDTSHAVTNPVAVTESESSQPSWVFRFVGWVSFLISRLFGIGSIIFLLAVAANIPIVQFLSFGYLLEVSGRLARKQTFRDAMIGLKKASVLSGIVMGTWLMLIPIRVAANFAREAYLIDPNSAQTQGLRFFVLVLIGLVVAHIAAAWMCGGKLRYFFWPLIAPFSLAIWLARRAAGSAFFRRIIGLSTGWISKSLVDDICNVRPVSDWFLPAIFIRKLRSGNVYANCRDGVWEFAKNLNLFYYFNLGWKGFVGTFLWLFIPTVLLVTASFTEGGASVLSGIFGVVFAIPIFMILPFLQAHFATDGKIKRFLEVRTVFKNYGRAPFAHLTALFLALVLALPLFFLKIEEIPGELLWTLSIVFVVFSWPARLVVGWAYRRGAVRENPSRWWVRFPLVFLAMPVALSFALILTLTRYISWNGAFSLYENHVFLLPAPFWM
ncbi:MAG: hypothetical protein AB8B55_16170 [Mariniblastus sp.]